MGVPSAQVGQHAVGVAAHADATHAGASHAGATHADAAPDALILDDPHLLTRLHQDPVTSPAIERVLTQARRRLCLDPPQRRPR